ncbi:MAG: DNA repair protein RecO [Candidatus Vogelbacteria bacterium CG10_big_fil_rev_8_21_14_0_10_45_14]|uniref:DNA repair protein RecO n=1 Tax=Candidatus Vogelbacteria bacterium CG10_big_fil_rev_8_21_14_0_10_45_14 TaxID=1975042 RepID=A0A2H0RJN4_9BACT|nr:MAG: DNA repair protein RecO [Candidatus Vogelbacteria bacterium CG10_big_fil_rev_8_21_14_0_10_45_14]
MYHFYNTECFVLGAEDISEGSRLLTLFTRELGLVRVHARSIRVERSKLRSFLQPYSFAEVSLVRGREFWRLTTGGVGFGALILDTMEKRCALARISALSSRLIVGEERDSSLYEEFFAGTRALTRLNQEELRRWELLLMARLLSLLGYGDLEPVCAGMKSVSWDEDAISFARGKEQNLARFVDRALSASQL